MSEDAGGASASNAVLGPLPRFEAPLTGWGAALLLYSPDQMEAERQRCYELGLATMGVRAHHAECDAQAAEDDRAELLEHLAALVDRYAYDGVPIDSLPVWQEARGVVERMSGPNVANKLPP